MTPEPSFLCYISYLYEGQRFTGDLSSYLYQGQRFTGDLGQTLVFLYLVLYDVWEADGGGGGGLDTGGPTPGVVHSLGAGHRGILHWPLSGDLLGARRLT